MEFKLQQLLWIFFMSAVARAWIHDSSMTRLRKFSRSGASQASKVTRPSFVPKIPEHCRNQGVCSDVPNYPQEYIDELVQRNSTVANALNFVAHGFDTPAGCQSSDRDPNDIKLCASKIALILAKAGQDSDGNWRFLVGENWMCVELCEKAGEKCSHEGINVFTNFKATCIQKHISKRAVGLDSNGDLGYFEIRVNSSCCCHVTQNNYMTRLVKPGNI